MGYNFVHRLPESLTTISREPGWIPSYLRRRILSLFVITFSAIIAALEILYQSSEARNGIAASTESRHYLWTYGPTAILTVVATLWSRVEFQTKQSAPWQAMLESPQPADKSVLLDYISDMQPVAIWKAFKHKHFAVASAVSCSLLLRLLIIFSTSLFSLQDVQVKQSNVTIQIHDKFSAQDSTMDTVGSQPYDILNGILFENVTSPMGTNMNLTFQEFSAPNIASNSIITAPINGLMADFTCEEAILDIKELSYMYYDASSRESVDSEVDIYTSSCRIANISLISDETTPTGLFQGGNCQDTTDSDDYRIVLTMAQPYKKHVTASKPPAGHRHDGSTGWKRVHIGIKRAIPMICKPSLSLLKLRAEGNATESLSNVHIQNLASEDAALPGMTAGDIAQFIVNNSTATTGFRPVEDSGEFEYYAQIDRGFNLGLHLIGADLAVKTLWEDGMLQDTARAFYRAITALLMHMGLVKREQSAAVGSAIVHENRVTMAELPLRGMEVCLGLGILLAISMILLLPTTPTATWDPNFITTIAAITANSAAFRSSLCGNGVVSHKNLQTRLVGKHYCSHPTPKGTSIEITDDSRRESQFDPNFGSDYATWKPFPARVGRIVIFILVSSTIAALETLLRVSQANNGLGDANLSNEYLHYSWTIVPALAMVGISLLFGSMDFNIRCLAPYAPLVRAEGAIFERSMNLSFLNSLGIINSFRSITSRHFAVQATTLATSAAFFLTIVTSGLYSVIEVPFHANVNFTRVGGFPDPRTIAGPQRLMNEAKEVNGMFTAEYILQYNFTYPRWTYEDLAFAEISIDKVSDNKIINGSYVDIKVPALRLVPVCEPYTSTELQATFGFYDGDETSGSYDLSINETTMPCPGHNTYSHGNISVLSVKDLESQPFGKSFQNQCFVKPKYNTGLIGMTHYTTFYVWGFINESSIQHIRGLSCIQYAETVDVWTRFKLPGLDIDEETPPIPDESSAKLAPDLYTPIPEWWILNSNGKYPNFDGFFQDLTSGRYAIPIENFESSEHDLTVIDAIKRQYKIISAQQFNNYTRGTANDSINHAPLLGNVTTPNRLRVVQDVTSTRLLEGLLALILALGITGSLLLNTDRILPKNPCSIASVASMLADSNFLDEFEQGLWSPENKQLSQAFVRHRFRLGWWGSEGVGTPEINKRLFAIDHRQLKTQAREL
ncbi:hypothetical protein N7532_006695 [Penicillium argentinense]|uniref:Uncharacterized protein n=1 Tax=Penicillium argentinense TaxID=1131581 RepID=A0A9W9FGI1_9EURO|nr:uncharacterized protein N7532_006695 [Penicillium argentinense]KAJ5099694.1 hypothetical protein N7532_006695 [Penicillium argentinense]